MLIFTMPPPSLAAGTDGRLYAAWHDARNGDWDAFLRRSADGGRTWAPAQRLNDDPPGGGAHQYLPRLAVAPKGRVDAAFYDRRRDARNLRNDLFFTTSTDGGRSFAPNVRVTTESSTSLAGARYPIPSARGQYEGGARIGLLAEPGGAVAAWAEARFADHGQGAQQVWASRIEVDAGDRPKRWPWAALGVVTLAAGALWLRGRHRGRALPGTARVDKTPKVQKTYSDTKAPKG
ncbi:MAG: sialidase family protein [Acidimicrobiales bacterium]